MRPSSTTAIRQCWPITSRAMVEGWTPEPVHHRGHLVALTQGLPYREPERTVDGFPSQRLRMDSTKLNHAAASVEGAAARWSTYLRRCAADYPDALPVQRIELLFDIVHRIGRLDLKPTAQSARSTGRTLRIIRQPDQQPLRLTYQEKKDGRELRMLC